MAFNLTDDRKRVFDIECGWERKRGGEKMDKISVVIPVKNEEDTIERCLEAVFSQSLKPHEVIVVDGHSSDGTVERTREFPAKVVYEDYGTVGGARQVGVLSAEGEIVAFTDVDCKREV